MDEKEKIERAKHCSTCLDWLNICNAECCKIFSISKGYCISNHQCDFSKKYIIFKVLLSLDMQWYIRLRGFTYARGVLKIPSKYCVIKRGNIYIYKDCNQLKNNLCLGHPNSKPNICRELTLETIKTMKGIIITPNCLFKYKLEGIEHGNVERET